MSKLNFITLLFSIVSLVVSLTALTKIPKEFRDNEERLNHYNKKLDHLFEMYVKQNDSIKNQLLSKDNHIGTLQKLYKEELDKNNSSQSN